ncbi:MAG: hypothetical protein KBE04_10050 [Phycisphaerae bacterium]|nr:hypothetical protein [Phycisphaerae bacterium]
MTAPDAREQGGLIRWLIRLGVVGLLAWAIPGAGYWALGDRQRAIVVGVTILAVFVLGLYIGSIGVVDSENAGYWYAAQVITSPVVFWIGSSARTGHYTVYGRPYEIGQIYTSIAGLLNLLCIINALYRAHVREVPGQEESA